MSSSQGVPKPIRVGDYDVQSSAIGSGTQGQVMKAVHVPTGQSVALKVYPLDTPVGKRGFLNEVNAFAILKNRAGVLQAQKSFQWEEAKGVIVMELMDCDLLAVLTHQRPDEDATVRLFHSICVGAYNMHQVHLAHLDIKPENILLNADGLPVVCDFGASVEYKSGKKYRGRRGTPGYTCPEMAFEQPFSPEAADVWSLGILLHVMLTGFFPYDACEADCTQQFSPEQFSTLYRQNRKLSYQAISLLNFMLVEDGDKRPSMSQVMQHSFFDVSVVPETSNPTETITSKLRRAVRPRLWAPFTKSH